MKEEKQIRQAWVCSLILTSFFIMNLLALFVLQKKGFAIQMPSIFAFAHIGVILILGAILRFRKSALCGVLLFGYYFITEIIKWVLSITELQNFPINTMAIYLIIFFTMGIGTIFCIFFYRGMRASLRLKTAKEVDCTN